MVSRRRCWLRRTGSNSERKIRFKTEEKQNTISPVWNALLKCEAGAKAKSTVYVVKNQQESLLGRIDCEALGIIVVKSGGNPGNLEQVGRLSTIQLQCERQENQEEIDDKMTKLLEEFPQIFEGIGLAKAPPIHIHVKEGVRPVTQKLRPVPVSMMEPLREKLDLYVKEGVIEGPLGADEATGWVHNVVLTGKKWDPKAIRMNLDTRLKGQWCSLSTQYPHQSNLGTSLLVVIGLALWI